MKSSYLALYFDEDVSVKIAANLRNRGFDVQTALDARNLGETDDQQLKHASAKGRVFVTHNLKDFLALHKKLLDGGKGPFGHRPGYSPKGPKQRRPAASTIHSKHDAGGNAKPASLSVGRSSARPS